MDNSEHILQNGETAHHRDVIVVACDTISATQNISFGRALAGSREVVYVEAKKNNASVVQEISHINPVYVVLSRVTLTIGQKISDWARSSNKTVVYHIDDDLIDVPMSLGADKYKHYSNPERIATLRANMNAADLIYASTQFLGKRLAEHGLEPPIFSGSLYCSIDPSRFALTMPAADPVIGYMGTSGHAADLAIVVPAIERLLEEIPALSFEVFGTIQVPAPLLRFGSRVRYRPGVADYEQFNQRLAALGWWIGIAPLEDNLFNRCKADTKWVEYSSAGMAVIASDLPVYHHACADGAGVLVDDQGWYEALSTLLADRPRRRAMVARARDRLARLYSHDRLRDQIEQVFTLARTYQHARTPGIEA